MLVTEVFRYLKRRADKRPVRLTNFVSRHSHHGQRSIEPKVSIIIPTRDKYQLLLACIESIQTKTTYENYEIVIIDNASSEPSTLEYLQFLASTGIRVLEYPHAFNYSKIINYGVANTKSEYLCFLNNDTEVIEPRWLGLLMDHAIQSKVGVVGSKLLYPDGSIQHFGVALGYTGAAGHPLAGDMPEETIGISDVHSCFEVSAVTFACAVTSRETFNQAHGLREIFKVGLNDVDFALRLNTSGKKNIVCGKSCLLHQESKSRKKMSSFSGSLRASLEVMCFLKQYPNKSLRDQYFLP